MAAKKQKNILLSEEGFFFLKLLKDDPEQTDTALIEELLAVHAIMKNRETKRAKVFLYKNIVGIAESQSYHRAYMKTTAAKRPVIA